MNTTFIYCLIDRRTDEIRYVGKTINLEMRRKKHSNDQTENKRGQWLRSINYDFDMVVIDEATDDWQEREQFWISYLAFLGCRLTNSVHNSNPYLSDDEAEAGKLKPCPPILIENIESIFTESVISEDTGYTLQALWVLRTGQRVGKYSYPPALERGKHWDKIGSAVVYTEAGRAVVMERAEKRNNKTIMP